MLIVQVILPEQVLPRFLQLRHIRLCPDGGGHDGGRELPRRVLPLSWQLVLRDTPGEEIVWQVRLDYCSIRWIGRFHYLMHFLLGHYHKGFFGGACF